MKILINTIPLLAPLTGIGKYTYYIAKKLRELDKNNKYFYYYGYFSKQLKSEEKTFMKQFIHRTKELIKTTPFSSHLRKLKNYLAGFSLKTFDLYFEPNFILLDKIKTKHRVVSVFDFSFDKYPQWHPKERIDFFRNNFWKSIKKADRIIVPSNFILREAKEEYGFDESLMQTVYLGIDFEIFRNYPGEVINEIINKYSLPENYILFVGSIEPRKNLKNLLHAYQSLPNYIKEEFKLVIVGFSGWENKEIMKLLDKDKGNIIYTGYVSEKELACIYNKAQLFVFPSFYEGFGLPPIEAMACSCPVLVSNKASLPEICGEGAFYCDPNSSDSIAESIYKILSNDDLKKKLILDGKKRVKIFKWDETTRKMLTIFEEVAFGKKGINYRN